MALLICLLSLTLLPPPPLSVLLARQKNVENLNSQHRKEEREGGGGKGWNSRYGRYWKMEKVLFNGSVSTILQLVVISCQWEMKQQERTTEQSQLCPERHASAKMTKIANYAGVIKSLTSLFKNKFGN